MSAPTGGVWQTINAWFEAAFDPDDERLVPPTARLPTCSPAARADVTTLLPVVERLRTRFGISPACVVADRGMISAATIAGLEEMGIDYILGVRERSTVEVRTTVINDDGVAVPLTIPRQKGETDLAIRMSSSVGVAMSWPATPNRPARMPRPGPNCWPVSNAS
jgi:hypothetical protein